MDELVTRDYQETDWQQVRLIHDQARPIELEGSCDPRAFIPLADDQSDLAEFQQCQKIVACLDDTIVGFVGISGVEIGWLYVDPDESGKGVGRFLLKAALAAIKTSASVHVLDGNKRAINLYLSEGFSIADTFKSDNNGYACTVLKLSQSKIL